MLTVTNPSGSEKSRTAIVVIGLIITAILIVGSCGYWLADDLVIKIVPRLRLSTIIQI